MCDLTLKCYAKLQQTNVEVLFFFGGGGGGGGGMAGGKKIKLDISCELSSLIKFFFPEKEKIIYSNFTWTLLYISLAWKGAFQREVLTDI